MIKSSFIKAGGYINSRAIPYSLTIGLFMISLFVVSPLDGYIMMLIRSFAIQWFAMATLAVICWALTNRFFLALMSFIAVVLLKTVLPVGNEEVINRREKADDQITIAHFNVLKTNRDFESTLHQALQTGADFISFQEVDSEWEKQLESGLKEYYPYSFSVAREECCYGLSVYSRQPFMNSYEICIEGLPNVAGSICLNDKQISFITSHTKSPITPANYRARNRHIEQLNSVIDSMQSPVFAIGDFNSVPWDSSIAKFKSQSGLTDSRKGLNPTYPSWLPPVRVPIDYIFHSREISCIEFNTISGTSSDHLGIVGKYSFPNETQLARKIVDPCLNAMESDSKPEQQC